MKMHVSTRLVLVATAVAALISVSTTLTGNWILATVTGLPFYLVLPGYLFQLAFRRTLNLDVPSFVYAVGLSLLTWLLGGLAINTLLPLLHVAKPLQLSCLIGLYLSVIVALSIAIKLRGAEVYFTYTARRSDVLALAAAFMLPILSVIGSTVLNNGGTGTVSILMLVLANLYILVLSIGHRRFSQSIYAPALFGLSVSLLLMYSMRSWHVLGWDVHQEMEVFSATLAHERWSMSYFPGLDYNACLSITILPTVLVKLLRITPEYIFKFVFQLIFAVTPVAIYATARRYFPPVIAFLAGVLFISQTWFFELMPALNRQEIAIVFFALFLFALTNNTSPYKVRRAMLYLCSLGLVLSHYSTTYLWLTMCIIAVISLWVLRLFVPQVRRSKVAMTWPLLIASTLIVFLWQGPSTNTSGNTNSNLSGLNSQISQAFSPKAILTALHSALIGLPSTTDKDLVNAYDQAGQNRPGLAGDYYSPQTYANYTPVAVDTDVQSQNYLPGSLSALLHLALAVIKALTNNLMMVLGLGVLAFYALRRRRETSLDFIALCIASYAIVFGALLIPYVAQIYNLPRLGLQSFVMLVIPIMMGFWFLLRKVKWAVPITAVVIVSTLGSQSGLIDQFTGGVQHMTLNQHGTMETFYVKDDEIAAAQWLAVNNRPHIPVFADPMADLRLHQYAGIGATNELIFPNGIPKSSYVYLYDYETSPGYTYLAVGNLAVYYNTPTNWLNANKNLVFSAGGSRVYR